jgi:hypothetical protein
MIGLPILLQENIYIAHRHMNYVEIGTEAALVPVLEYINRNFLAATIYLLNPEKVEKGLSFVAVHDSGTVQL